MRTSSILLIPMLACLMACCCPKGSQSERIVFTDSLTGNEVWQITNDTSRNCMPYFEHQAFTSDDRYVVFKSTREGGIWKLFRSDMRNGKISQVSTRAVEGPYTIMPNGREVAFMEGSVVYATDVATLKERVLVDVTGRITGERVRFGSTFTNDEQYTIIASTTDSLGTTIYRVHIPTGRIDDIYTAPTRCSHPILNPADADIITYVPYPDRQNDTTLTLAERARDYIINVRTGENRYFLSLPGYRETHETWTSDGERFFFFRKKQPGNRPVTVCSVDKTGGDFREEYHNDTIKMGHGICSHDRRWFIADAQEQDINPLMLISLKTGDMKIICWPNTREPRERNDQDTHVHPLFSVSGKYVAFTSNCGTDKPRAFVIPVEKFTSADW